MGRMRASRTQEPTLFASADEAFSAVAPEQAAPDVVAAPRAWRVVKPVVVSMRGQLSSLYAGKLLPVTAYDAQVIRGLLEQGVELEPVA